MIVYELGCTQGHRFEGWFASAADFARQSESAMVRCPTCDDADVVIVPSARVRISKGGAASRSADRGSDAAAAVPANPAPQATSDEHVMNMPTELLRKLRETIRNTEDVGRRFPEEARKIHYEEVPPRAIRGQASSEEADSLREEGIEFASLPPFLVGEQH